MNEQLRATLNSLPHKPGIYIYKDENGVIIYVGKATSLASRARSYFQESANHSLKTKALVSHISDMEYIVVGSPTEALILENEYISKQGFFGQFRSILIPWAEQQLAHTQTAQQRLRIAGRHVAEQSFQDTTLILDGLHELMPS